MHNITNSRKRPRIGSSYNSTEIPATVNERNFYDENKQSQYTISAEFDTQKIIQSVLLSAADSTTVHQMPSGQNEQYNSFHMLSGNLNSAGMLLHSYSYKKKIKIKIHIFYPSFL